jgi:hypothetical protein
LIPPIAAAALCIKPKGELSRHQAIKVAVLKAASDDFITMRRLAMQFQPYSGGEIRIYLRRGSTRLVTAALTG